MPTTNQNDQGQGQAPEGQAPVDPNITALASGLENLRLAGVVYLATKPRRRRRG